MAVTKKQSSRIDFEDAFVKALNRKGVTATASHTLVAKLDDDADAVLAAATAANLDMILLTRYIGASSEDVFHPGTIYYGVAPAYGGGYIILFYFVLAAELFRTHGVTFGGSF